MKNNVYSVSQVNNYIKLLLDDDVLLNKIYIEGEISNFKNHSTGHLYFTIKDEECSINAIMYKDYATDCRLELYNGLKIICFGKISSYPKTGQYQIYVQKIETVGKGNVFLDFEKLKEKLLKEGIFDKAYKKEIPKMPKSIGVVTSETGAVIRDIVNVAKRRNPSVRLVLIPSLVQGENAVDSIVEAIYLANEYKKLDVLIVSRGGGSREDLGAFNDEKVAYAIFNSEIPIVTGIGHETDFTIADFVADCRAETPSSAVEICVQKIDSLKEILFKNYNIIDEIMKNKILKNKIIFEKNINKYYFNNFADIILNYKINIKNNVNYINNEIVAKIKEKNIILKNNMEKIEYVSPMNVLKKGYTLIMDDNEKIIKSKEKINIGDNININFHDGGIVAKVIK